MLLNQQDQTCKKYQISHVWRCMVGRMAGDKPITNRTLSFKNGKLGTHMCTCKAGPNPPLSKIRQLKKEV
jgi:hypothetical protein